MSREHSEACVRAGLPIILMGRIVTRPGVDSVLADNANGVFCGSDSIAFGVIEAARALGLSIPDHLSVVGFNNVPPADWRSFRLTTIEYPIGRTIETIVDLLDKRLADPAKFGGYQLN